MKVANGEKIRCRMRARQRTVIPAIALLGAVLGGIAVAQPPDNMTLPSPALKGSHSLEQLLEQRRSIREFDSTPLTLAQLGQLLWAAQGITTGEGFRTAPSAGALYPLELYVVVGNVADLAPGIYHYEPRGHRLMLVKAGDSRRNLAAAALQQTWISTAPAVVVFGAVYARTAAKYGSRAERYIPIEVGHAAENLFLQAEDLGLGACDVGAFNDQAIIRAAHLPREVAPLLLMPVGKPR